MSTATDPRPHPPGTYPVVIVGSGPGGLQASYLLDRMGIQHAVLSADAGPGGMFRRFPFFQRLLSWTKPHAGLPKDTRRYERHWTPVHLDFHVHDFDEALARILRENGMIENEFRTEGPMPAAFCSDPFGNGFCVIGETRRSA